MVINMKKIFAIVISLLFVVSVFGVASTMAGLEEIRVTATPENVKVGELITVTTNFPSSQDPTIIADGNKPKGDAVLVSRPEKTEAKGLFPVERTWTWVYRATAPGTIKFDFEVDLSSGSRISNPVTIATNSYPMNSFMKILGFGNESA